MSAGLAFLAGLLSTLSPCVLPLLPVVLGTAASAHRHGPVALAGGLALSFVGIGLFVATIGFGLGLDGAVFRRVAALLLVLVGAILVVPAAQPRLAVALGPIADRIERRFGGFVPTSPWGQFGIGLLLGAVWSPCVGPTLGGRLAPGGAGSRPARGRIDDAAVRPRGRAAAPRPRRPAAPRTCAADATGQGPETRVRRDPDRHRPRRPRGTDKRVEAALVEASPAWLTRLTTLY